MTVFEVEDALDEPSVGAHQVPARVLAYSLYGSSESGEEIAELNQLRDSSFVTGDFEVLSS